MQYAYLVNSQNRNSNTIYSSPNYTYLVNPVSRDKNPIKSYKFPKFYRWGGGGIPFKWSFGWLTGRDNDLVCVKPRIYTPVAGEIALSPVCSNRVLAIIAFVMKAILVKVDYNLRGLEG